MYTSKRPLVPKGWQVKIVARWFSDVFHQNISKIWTSLLHLHWIEGIPKKHRTTSRCAAASPAWSRTPFIKTSRSESALNPQAMGNFERNPVEDVDILVLLVLNDLGLAGSGDVVSISLAIVISRSLRYISPLFHFWGVTKCDKVLKGCNGNTMSSPLTLVILRTIDRTSDSKTN